MSPETIIFIVFAGIISLILAIFMYGYKTKYSRKQKWIFGGLRFLTLFFILILLVNPKFKFESFRNEKPKLPVLIDNSLSVSELEQDQRVKDLLSTIENHQELNNKFDVSYYSFGNDFKKFDSLTFLDNNSNLSKALRESDELHKNEIAPTIFITDGNQTLGSDYEFQSIILNNPVYPIILGDTTTYFDMRIELLNTNRYAFLKNRFPVEVMLVFSGSGEVSTSFSIRQGNTVVYSENVSFSDKDNSKTLSFTLPSTSVGLKKYLAQINPIKDEKNIVNNRKQFAVEVIDQSTNILIISNLLHPDLGMLKKSIESNEQRKVTLANSSEAISAINDHQLILLYQPDRSFRQVFSEIKKLNKNSLIITGLKTDWIYLNGVQNNFRKDITKQTEEVEGFLNLNYSAFSIDDIGFNEFPPLKTYFGALEINVPNEFILEQTIDGFTTESALLATFELNGIREAIIDGEGIWRWRAQSYLNSESFNDFDDFMGRIIQYLASDKRRSRLEVDGKTFYYNNSPIRLSVQYFDKNYQFDSRASLSITVINSETNEQFEFPLLLKKNYYTVDLNNLPSGEYNYKVFAKKDPVSKTGSFTILEFNVEQQFLNADVTKLHKVATNTKGKSYFISQHESLFDDLINDERYRLIQKTEQKIVPLIDWKYLLMFIVITLSLEWFIRKYNGLI